MHSFKNAMKGKIKSIEKAKICKYIKDNSPENTDKLHCQRKRGHNRNPSTECDEYSRG